MGLFNKLKKMAAETAGSVLDDIPGADRFFDSNSSKNTCPPQNSLSAPPPPPIPQSHETMSVRIAVNGTDYGPYEKATLVEMIANGSLTPQTLVFMEGMTQWTPAEQVPKVNELFQIHGSVPSVPPVPPVPWSSSPAPQPTAADDGLASTLSPKLKSLVISAIADGEISDLERQVLIRNAQAEGMAIDEFAIIVDAMLYNQRQVLKQQKERHEHELNLAKVHATASMPPPAVPVKENKRPQVRKCPACGEIINDVSAACCPQCGYEFEITETYNPIQPLIDKIEEIDREFSNLSPLKQPFLQAQFYQRKTTAISTFKLPVSRNTVLDFLSFAATAHGNCQFGDPMKKAWKTKMEEVISTARMKYPNDNELKASMAILAKKVGIKVK